jgi:hypothetical protein
MFNHANEAVRTYEMLSALELSFRFPALAMRIDPIPLWEPASKGQRLISIFQ